VQHFAHAEVEHADRHLLAVDDSLRCDGTHQHAGAVVDFRAVLKLPLKILVRNGMRVDDAITLGVGFFLRIGSALAVQFAAVALAAVDLEHARVGVLLERSRGDDRLVWLGDGDGADSVAGGDLRRAGMNAADVALAVD
jgi:hypothetical protein